MGVFDGALGLSCTRVVRLLLIQMYYLLTELYWQLKICKRVHGILMKQKGKKENQIKGSPIT